MSPIAGDAGKLLTVQEFDDILIKVEAAQLLNPLVAAELRSLLQHDINMRQRILWLERENEELRYHLDVARQDSTHALLRCTQGM